MPTPCRQTQPQGAAIAGTFLETDVAIRMRKEADLGGSVGLLEFADEYL